MFALNPAVAAATALSLLSSISHAQILPIDQFFNLTTFPNEQSENVTRYLNEAADLATDRLIYQYFQDQCITQQLYPKLFSFPPGFVEPFSPFENLFFVGHSFVSAWAYNTTAGLVLIDALDNPSEIDAILLPALAKFGFQGADIKHVIITHEHVDHYGGAKYLQDSFGPTIYASRAAWDALAGLGPTADPLPPAEDAVVADGDVLAFGGVDFEVVLTPGHTPGTLSLIFPVREGEAEHVAGLSGGTGTPADAGARAQKVESQYRFAAVARERGVDTLVSNHQVADHALFLADLLAHRGAGKPNPFVVGVDNFERYMKINGLCSRVIAAREGMDLHA
ncbi:Beta-lactamase-like protein [Macrophomina phaseolina MS6]|uniref:Beta-lactamase-like protein n=1 Tax=Macrophomina phaseolina (strain MS6) TaxID=1126212 RepID=K2S4B6_MACPH|nr:Beta-lactamase-like protein [Macrophomina phaseolina MS6]